MSIKSGALLHERGPAQKCVCAYDTPPYTGTTRIHTNKQTRALLVLAFWLFGFWPVHCMVAHRSTLLLLTAAIIAGTTVSEASVEPFTTEPADGHHRFRTPNAASFESFYPVTCSAETYLALGCHGPNARTCSHAPRKASPYAAASLSARTPSRARSTCSGSPIRFRTTYSGAPIRAVNSNWRWPWVYLVHCNAALDDSRKLWPALESDKKARRRGRGRGEAFQAETQAVAVASVLVCVVVAVVALGIILVAVWPAAPAAPAAASDFVMCHMGAGTPLVPHLPGVLLRAAFSVTPAAAASLNLLMPHNDSAWLVTKGRRYVAEQSASSWAEVSEAIGKISKGASGKVSLASNFKCNYTKEIAINGKVMLHGNNVTCDAGGHGRFFSVVRGATFRLDWIALKGGHVDDNVRAWFCLCVLCIRSSVVIAVYC